MIYIYNYELCFQPDTVKKMIYTYLLFNELWGLPFEEWG